jgi:serine/threonine-protein kinase
MEESTSQAGSFRNHLVGQQIGSYRVLDTLGSGGMSTVYRGMHAETGHEVALKVLLGTLSRNSTLLQRFLREARSAETLEHFNIVTIYDRGVDHGRHYLVLEYVAGGDFHDYVQRIGPLGAGDAVAVVRGIASGLRYAARRGLIHRDIKPSNILRTPRGEPKIIDLGLALQSEFEDERVTREGTTVGTVDYMAPEQARDSRATSIFSDMYSLGCTFYYLLAGVPPYPGGDITEKLTRHARAPAPDIRDLRPDIPPELAAILLRLMAKQPEDRFPDYDHLIAALDAVGRAGEDASGVIALVPLEGDEPVGRPTPPAEAGPGRIASADISVRHDEDGEPLLLESLNGPSLELADERDPVHLATGAIAAGARLPRLGRMAALAESEGAMQEQGGDGQLAPRVDRSFPRWILAVAAVATIATLLVVGLHLIFGGPRAPELALVEIPDPDRDAATFRTATPSGRSPGIKPVPRSDREGPWTRQSSEPARPPAPSKRPREEPDDKDPVPGELGPIPADIQERRGHLPEWTRSRAAPRTEDPTVVVRRAADVADPADGTTEPTLHLALDGHIGGSVELADDGPHAVDDLRMSGESRVIRARPGYRPIIRILRSRPGPALEQSAFLTLERKSLTLEGLDLIVDAHDLSGNQKALFGCVGSNLTFRDCTITVINPTGVPFTLVRQEPAPRQERPARIWLERTLIRGSFVTVAELTGGPADLVLDGTAVVVGGEGPPVVRVSGPGGSEGQRIFLANAVLACPGPVVHRDPPEGAAARVKPLVIRADGSAVGRLQGPGIASIVTSTDEKAAAERQVAWSGDSNLFAGWKGFFACGRSRSETTLRVDNLAEARSTWNATEQGSEWILQDWALSGDPARLVAGKMSPILPGRHSLMALPARPSVGLFPKTFEAYLDPLVPEPARWLPAQLDAPATPGPRRNTIVGSESRQPSMGGAPSAAPPRVAGGGPGASPSSSGAADDLVMRTSDPQWSGDLGAFLRGRIPPDARHVRVLVVGSGAHRFTPVRLPDGLTLEVHVEADPRNGGLPSWSPDPHATGPGLIELRGGALVLSNLILRHDPVSKLESLLTLDDSHLVLFRCQLTVPPDSGGAAGDLIVFRSPTTQPMPDHPGNAAFQKPVDRPACRLIDTVLIANRTALRAELGRGLVALTRCAVASDETVIELVPARVARRSFGADLWLDRCTLVAGRSIVRLGPWPGVRAGPDRPWLINSRRCAFITLSDTRTRDAVLLRVDADAYAGGCLFWQADGDAYELDRVAIAGEVPPAAPRRGEIPIDRQWDYFWSAHHATRGVTGPRSAALRFRLPRTGRIEPSDLILDPAFPGQRGSFGVGADLPGTGSGPRRGFPATRPN